MMKNYKKNEEAVSPVIGVILMAAITAILAAVIAAFVFGMAGTVEPGKIVALTADRVAADSIRVTNYGGANVGDLVGDISVSVTEDDGITKISKDLDRSVGSSITFNSTDGDFNGGNRIIAIGIFRDGSTTILFDMTL